MPTAKRTYDDDDDDDDDEDEEEDSRPAKRSKGASKFIADSAALARDDERDDVRLYTVCDRVCLVTFVTGPG
jgi:hypothetical protein